jgi:hypothetical protein
MLLIADAWVRGRQQGLTEGAQPLLDGLHPDGVTAAEFTASSREARRAEILKRFAPPPPPEVVHEAIVWMEQGRRK